jgi:hypothetical protein
MKSIVPEALSSSGAGAGTYPDQTSNLTGQNIPLKKKQPAVPKRCGLMRGWLSPPLAMKLVLTDF